MINPCTRDCPDRRWDCRLSCPKHQAWREHLQALRKAKERERMLDEYTVKALHDNRRRYGWKNGRPKH